MSNESLTYKMKLWIEKLTADIDANESAVLNKVEDFPGNKTIIKYAIDDIEKLSPTDEIAREIINFLEWYSTGKITGIKVVSK